MKQVINLIIIIIAVIFTGCKKDFLDPVSLSTFDKTLVFSNIDDARKATNNVYRQFGEDGYRTRLSITMQGNSDISVGGDRTSSKDNYQILALDAVAGNGDLKKAWQSAYAAIKDCNVVIDGILASDLYNSTTDEAASADMHQFIGEAYAIRAFWYSNLVYQWGDVPFTTAAPKAGMDFNLPKTDRNLILSSMIKDLIKAEPTMKWADELPHSVQQVNREFVIGLIARLSLQRAGYYLKPDMTKARGDSVTEYYTIARDYCEKLMTLKDRTLPRDFAQVFKNECQNIYPSNSDMLFEIPFALTTGEVGYNIGMRLESGDNNPYGRGGHDFSLTPNYFYSFDAKDLRRDVTCGMYDLDKNLVPSVVRITDIPQGKWSKEYCDPSLGTASFKGTGINWVVMRYADVLLMFAEAENELNGPDEAAQNALKRVRERAFDSGDWATKVDDYVNSVSASKESFFNAIVNERAWEFGGELLRKYDLIRWGLYSQKMTQAVDEIKALADESLTDNPSAKHASYIYYRVDNKKITIFKDGLYNNGAVPPGYIPSTGADLDGNTLPLVNGWVRADWTSSLWDSGTNDYNAIIDKRFGPYIESSPVRYIQPIPAIAIDNSGGVLANDGYGFQN
ncbi:starch-binding protein [Prolixibacter bellariivorans]|uniref:Starch-binding protein n=1 Tax=Prolixibacter bellariivorans TaxID=314319 RepID=A0A5M4ATQ7_9BACT|nr:RagB/SusD family nutrient uptake outer membrane protein [Prolixibacter bellariivorans]GET31309.1 starch-binding protein [Prolixibacter bellariivorans]